jgi:hypothetical protein
MTIEEQIEKAYDFRGHVTVILRDGKTLVGFLYNRVTGADAYIELYPKDKPGSVKFAYTEIAKVDCTGEDCAAGDSYQDYLKRKAEREKGEFTGAQ